MRILITGSSGFIGSAILNRFADCREFQVVGTFRNRKPNLSATNIRFILLPDLNPKHLHAIFKKNSFDLLIHCAWEGLPNRSKELSLKNFIYSRNIFEIFAKTNESKIIMFGSSLENLQFNTIAKFENSKIVDLEFGQIKRDLSIYLQGKTKNYVWIKPYYLYGKNQHIKSLFQSTLNNLKNDSTWLKNPFQINDFTYLSDLGDFLFKIVKDDKAYGAKYEFGSGLGIQNIEFVNKIRRTVGFPVYNLDSNVLTQPFVADTKAIFDLYPDFAFTSLDLGIRKVVNEMSIS
jgi:nucleoside-diphosphate-sugar epimerase